MSDLHVKVIIRNTDRDKSRRVNIKTGVREVEAWDGDHQLVLSRNGPAEQNLTQKIEELRMRPQLAALSVPAARGVQDTLILWGAWKNSMMDSLCQLFETRSYFYLQKVCDQDEATTRHRISDLIEQLNTTLSSWRSQIKFLTEEKVQLIANLNNRTDEVAACVEELNRQDKSKSIFRVLVNAVKAVDHTNTEKLTLWKQKANLDYDVHLQTLQGLFKGLLFCVQTFKNDAWQLKQQSLDAQADIDGNVQAKQDLWAQVCQEQFLNYQQSLQNPLAKLIKEIDPSAPENTMVQSSLDNNNDPHCLRRCEAALMMLRQAQAKIIGHPYKFIVDTDADDILQYAQRERAIAEIEEHQKYTERWIALQSEHAQRENVIQRTQTRLQQLQETSQQIQQNLQQAFSNPEADQRKLALASRLAEQQLTQLKEDIKLTSETIAVEKRALDNMQANLSTYDRKSIVQLILDATHKVYSICMTMKSRFVAATQAENLLRQMIYQQCMTGINDAHQICQSIIYRMVQVAQTQCAAAQINLDRLQDAYNEAGRRVDILHRGRVEQEERATGEDIGLYRAIEEYADALTQKHLAQESVNRAEILGKTAQGAVDFINTVISSFETIM